MAFVDNGYDGSPLLQFVVKEVRAGTLPVEDEMVQQLCQHEMRMDHIHRSVHQNHRNTQQTIQSLTLPFDKLLSCLQSVYASLGRR
jgi:hypothetical protein